MNIGSRIKHRRELLGMSQEELAKKVGYKSRSSVNKIEIDGRGLPQSKIVAFANALETTPAYLMGWDEQQLIEELRAEHETRSIYDIYSSLGYETYTLVRIFSDLPQEGKDLLLIQAYGYASHFLGGSYKIDDENTLMKLISGVPDTEESCSNIIPFSSGKEAREYLKTKEHVISAFITDGMTDEALINIANTIQQRESESKN